MKNIKNKSLYNDIFEASLKARIYDVCRRTPLEKMTQLSLKVNNDIWLKREDQQITNSFKVRGAITKLKEYSLEQLANGVMAASAGNHAQGVAIAALHRKVKATIFMPLSTPKIKVEAVKALEAEVNLIGASLKESLLAAKQAAKKQGAILIEGYNDKFIIAGQGTMGLEILQDCPVLPDAVFIQVGGGGMISGIALVIKKLYPDIKIIGVEPVDCNSMTASIKNNSITELENINTFAEGVAVAKVGSLNFECCQDFVDDFINVTSDEICFAIKLIHDNVRAIAEPSGAVGLAGSLAYIKQKQWQNKKIIAINSGSNIDFERFRYISERIKIGEGKEILFAVRLKEHRGTLKQFCKLVLTNLKISEFNYRYYHQKDAVVFVGIESTSSVDVEIVRSRLEKNNYQFFDLTNDELAKNHLKYMIGGRLPMHLDERVFQFNFTEGQNALVNFLNKMQEDWNISLCHYRTYGTDYGQIFLGINAPKSDNHKVDSYIKSLNYQFNEETQNIGYNLFLSK